MGRLVSASAIAYVLNVFRKSVGFILAGTAAAFSALLWGLLLIDPDLAYAAWGWFAPLGRMGAWLALVLAVLVLVVAGIRAVDAPAFLDGRAYLTTLAWMAGASVAAVALGVIPGGGALAALVLFATDVLAIIALVMALRPDAAARRRRSIRHRALRVSGRLGRHRFLAALPIAAVAIAVVSVQLTPIDRGVCLSSGAFRNGDSALVYTDCGTYRMPVERYDEVSSQYLRIVTRGFDLSAPWALVPVAVELTVMNRAAPGLFVPA